MQKNKLGKKIFACRVMNNLSMSEMAKLCKVSASTICNIESGKTMPNKTNEAKILMAIQELELNN